MEYKGLMHLLEVSRQVGTRKVLEVFVLVVDFRVLSLESIVRWLNGPQVSTRIEIPFDHPPQEDFRTRRRKWFHLAAMDLLQGFFALAVKLKDHALKLERQKEKETENLLRELKMFSTSLKFAKKITRISFICLKKRLLRVRYWRLFVHLQG